MPASGNDASRQATTSSTNCRVASCLVSILEGVFHCVPLVLELALCNSWQVIIVVRWGRLWSGEKSGLGWSCRRVVHCCVGEMVFLHHLIQNGKDPNCIRKKRSETEEAVGGCCGGGGGGGS